MSDATSTTRLTLWQDDIGSLEVDESYEIANLLVKSYNNSKYLTSPKSGYTIKKIDDIGAVDELNNAEVAAVSSFSQGLSCLSCNGNVDRYNGKIGGCTKCSLKVRLDKCTPSLSVKLLIDSGGKTSTLTAYLPMIQAITEDDTTHPHSIIIPALTRMLVYWSVNEDHPQLQILTAGLYVYSMHAVYTFVLRRVM